MFLIVLKIIRFLCSSFLFSRGRKGAGFLLFFLFPLCLIAGNLEKGFEALKVFNYFEAKELFKKSMKSHPSGAYYGLSMIFYKNDNPFHHIDSAYKYILLSEKTFKSSDAKEKETLLKLSISQAAINQLKGEIIQQAFEKAKSGNTIESFTWFIKSFAHPALKKEAIKLRGTLAFENAKKTNTVQSYKEFIASYADAQEIKEAQALYELVLFYTMTKPNTLEVYEAFIKQFPKSPYRLQAEDSIFIFSTRNETIAEYRAFVKKYTGNHNVKKAWDLIYSLSTIDSSPSVIANFLFEYPDFPDKLRVKTDIGYAHTELFPVHQNGKWGFIDSVGAIRISCTYDWVDNFSEGTAPVIQNDKAGYINKSGAIVIPLVYDEVNPFHNGLAVVKKNGKFGLILKTGKQILPFEFEDISNDENNSGEKIIRAVKEGVHKFYDVKGKLLTEVKFDKAGTFSSGRAYIVQNGKYGFINKKGEVIVSPAYDWTENFSNGLARIKQNELFGLMDTTGKLLLPLEYSRIDLFSEGLALVIKEKKVGFADTQGNIAIPIKFDYSAEVSASNGFENGLAKVEQKKKRGLIDKTGKLVVPCEYEDIRNFYTDFCAVKKGKWGYIDKNKKQKINFMFDYAWDFSEGLARVKTKGKTGFINPKGDWVVPATYEEASDFRNGIAIVTLAGKKGVIDMTGKLLVPCETDEIEQLRQSIIRLEKNEKIAYYSLPLQKQVWAEEGF